MTGAETGLHVDCSTGRATVGPVPAAVLEAAARATEQRARWHERQAAQRAADLAVVAARAREDPAFAALARLLGLA